MESVVALATEVCFSEFLRKKAFFRSLFIRAERGTK
jgi:hypothetical protein